MLVLLTDLPDAALQRVVELASTPSTPGSCLLAGVSKGLCRASASVKGGTIIHLHFGQRAATLQEASTNHPPAEPCSWPVCQAGPGHLCLWRPEQRLLGLAQWLGKYASQVVSLCISYSTGIDPYCRYGVMAARYHERQAQADAVTAIVGSLREAAAHMPSSSGGSSSGGSSSSTSGRQPPSLPLQQLRLPAAGGLTNMSNTLAVCGGLRQLRLDASLTRNDTLLGYQRLCQALRGLTQLTALQLSDIYTGPSWEDEAARTLNPLFSSCPASLEVLVVQAAQMNTLSTSSLAHLTNLRQLRLQYNVVTVDGAGAPQLLQGLTCLTCLQWGSCVEGGRAILDLPQLRVFSTYDGPGQYLEQLVGKTSFHKLVVSAGAEGAAEVAAVAQLTHLTELVLSTWSRAPAAAWCAAFGALSQLQRLTTPMGHWRSLVPAVCKQLPQLRQLTLTYVIDIYNTQAAAGLVEQLQLLGQLQQLTFCGQTDGAVQCVAAAAVQALPSVEVRVVVACMAASMFCNKVIEDLLE